MKHLTLDELASSMRDFAIKEQLALSYDNLKWAALSEPRKDNWRKRAQHVLDTLGLELPQ